MSSGKINPTEVVAILIGKGKDYLEGIELMQNSIEGSSSIMLLTKDGVYLARDKFGRTPIVTGKKNGAIAATSETCAFRNRGFKIDQYLGPGEIGIITPNGYEQIKKSNETLQVCSFLWIYYGFPASNYEEINSEITRNKFGAFLARNDRQEIESGKLNLDFVAGIPDSGIGSGLGYSNESKFPYLRPYVKYTPTWQRSFMPQEQEDRDLVAEMKLILIPEIVDGKNILYTDDSIVRGTQLAKKIRELKDNGARDIHMRPSCPPLTHGCAYLNFSMSKNIFDLAAVRSIRDIEEIKRGDVERWNSFKGQGGLDIYLDENSEKYERMVDGIRRGLGLTTLKYPRLNDMVSAIGLPKEKLCLGCWRECESCNGL
jgi:amidophosphoribosyltransferase